MMLIDGEINMNRCRIARGAKVLVSRLHSCLVKAVKRSYTTKYNRNRQLGQSGTARLFTTMESGGRNQYLFLNSRFKTSDASLILKFILLKM